MSSECLKKPNYNLFFESEVRINEIEKNVYWYKISFYKDCFIKLTLIPNDENDRYNLSLYSVKRNEKFCDSRETIEDIEELVSFNDTYQTQSFRESVVYTKALEVFNDEAIYILINNMSGKDLGHILEIITCDNYSYILKVNKEKGNSDTTCFGNAAPSILENVPQKLCSIITDSVRFGYVNFNNEKITVDNLNRKEIDSIDVSFSNMLSKADTIKEDSVNITRVDSATDFQNRQRNSRDSLMMAGSIADQYYISFSKLFNKIKGNKAGEDYQLASRYAKYLEKNQSILLSENQKKGEKTKKPGRRRKVSSKAVKTTPVYFVTVDAETGIVLKQPAFKLIKEAGQRYLQHSYNDSISVFSALIETDNDYRIECDLIGYKNYSQHIDLKNILAIDTTFYYIIPLNPLKAGDRFVIPDIYFYPNTPVFKEQSYEELNKLSEYMNSNNVNILIAGHTNGNKYISKDKRQMDEELVFSGTAKKLSKKRAEAVRNYLVKSGVQKDRIAIKGYGGKKPIIEAPKNLKEGEKNMRVEVYII